MWFGVSPALTLSSALPLRTQTGTHGLHRCGDREGHDFQDIKVISSPCPLLSLYDIPMGVDRGSRHLEPPPGASIRHLRSGTRPNS